MFRKWLAVWLLLLGGTATAVGCGGKDSPAATLAKGPETYVVAVDGNGQGITGNLDFYFPGQFKVHAGDSVTFKQNDSGAPHTVTFGTLVDEAVGAIEKAGSPPVVNTITEVQKLPAFNSPVGPNQGAAQPCYLNTGAPPVAQPCSPEQRNQPEFNGTFAFYNSGWINPRGSNSFSLKVAADTKPGTSSFICLLHQANRIGKLTVVESETVIPGPDEVAKQGASELEAKIKAAQPILDTMKNAAEANVVAAGGNAAQIRGIVVQVFTPQMITTPVGGTVTWLMGAGGGGHTVSFNAPPDARGGFLVLPDGTLQDNLKARQPSNSPALPPVPTAPAGTPANDPNAEPVVIDAGPWDGQGFLNSGTVRAVAGGQRFQYKVTFTRPGTYVYACLVHPGMDGVVRVGN